MIIFAGFCTTTVFLVPETYAPVLLARKAKQMRKADPVANKDVYGEHERLDSTFLGLLERTIQRPFAMLAKEPILVLVTLYLSLVYGLLYARKYLSLLPDCSLVDRSCSLSSDPGHFHQGQRLQYGGIRTGLHWGGHRNDIGLCSLPCDMLCLPTLNGQMARLSSFRVPLVRGDDR